MDGLKRQNGIVLGVCGGIAARYNISPFLVRLIFLILMFSAGVGVIPYIVLAILMPKA
ncbi:MAG: PspC domain-containing protein [Chloroflexi bacterium]|nr:PspC domain-containing protein [Chloroflexota bacterium]